VADDLGVSLEDAPEALAKHTAIIADLGDSVLFENY
jgi:hypothetical protein